METAEFLRASFLVWMLPLLAAGAGLGLGWMLGNVLGNGSLWGAAFSLASFALSFLWLHEYDKSSRKSGRYLPVARSVRDL
jgi:positive regulator of sigma E activity